MITSSISQIEENISELPLQDQLQLLEWLVRRIRQSNWQREGAIDKQLAEMAEDPQIQAELRQIQIEFAITEADGLGIH